MNACLAVGCEEVPHMYCHLCSVIIATCVGIYVRTYVPPIGYVSEPQKFEI